MYTSAENVELRF